MIWYATGLLLILHVYLWGWGLTLLILPRAGGGSGRRSVRRWGWRCNRRWSGRGRTRRCRARTATRGCRSRCPRRCCWSRGGRASAGGRVAAAGGACAAGGRSGLVMAFSLTLQAYPFTRPPRVLTRRHDQLRRADYAAGARVFKEFAHGDRTGYLGVVEPSRPATRPSIIFTTSGCASTTSRRRR